jgi:hypothetical protein
MQQQILQRSRGFVFSANAKSLAAFALRGLLALIAKHDEPSCVVFACKSRVGDRQNGHSDLSHSEQNSHTQAIISLKVTKVAAGFKALIHSAREGDQHEHNDTDRSRDRT